jgi:HK97 gp10 family phage protein
MASFTIRGIEQLEAKLHKLSLVGQRKVLQKALKKGAEVIRQEAELRAPRGETGTLAREQIISVSQGDSAADQATVKIGASMKGFYGLFQELGTIHHVAQPFLEPALESKKDEAIHNASDILKDEIDKAVR